MLSASSVVFSEQKLYLSLREGQQNRKWSCSEIHFKCFFLFPLKNVTATDFYPPDVLFFWFFEEAMFEIQHLRSIFSVTLVYLMVIMLINLLLLASFIIIILHHHHHS